MSSNTPVRPTAAPHSSLAHLFDAGYCLDAATRVKIFEVFHKMVADMTGCAVNLAPRPEVFEAAKVRIEREIADDVAQTLANQPNANVERSTLKAIARATEETANQAQIEADYAATESLMTRTNLRSYATAEMVLEVLAVNNWKAYIESDRWIHSVAYLPRSSREPAQPTRAQPGTPPARKPAPAPVAPEASPASDDARPVETAPTA